MKVVMLGTRGFPNIQGGVEKHCEELSVNLVRNGCDVVVFVRKPYVKNNIKEFKGIKLISLPTIKQKALENIIHTLIGVFAALRYEPDILHFQAIGSTLFVPLARLLGMKVVVTSHGSNYKHLKWGRFAKVVLKMNEFLGVKFANGVIAISETIADEIAKKYRRKVAVIPNGIILPHIVTSENALNEYNLEKKKYILSVGRFVPEKGFHDLIDAFGQLPSTNYKLVIVGDADHEDRYSLRLKQEARMHRNIVLTGFLTGEPLQELYSHAGLFVLPSYYEGLPIALLEAMSYGLLCLASNIPANRSIGLSDENYFSVGNVEQLSTKLQEFFKKPLSVERKSCQIETLRQKYNWDNIARKTLEIYRKVALS